MSDRTDHAELPTTWSSLYVTATVYRRRHGIECHGDRPTTGRGPTDRRLLRLADLVRLAWSGRLGASLLTVTCSENTPGFELVGDSLRALLRCCPNVLVNYAIFQ